MKLSVIVPCYNVANTIKRTIESIIKNEIKDMEILVIDDFSTDNTYQVLESLAKKYKQICILKHKENKGLSEARNTGIKKAKGEYLSFIDGGDTIKPLMYKKMLEKAYSKDFDVVGCFEERIFPTYTKEITLGITKDCFNKKEIKEKMVFIYPSACTKIYKRAIFKDIFFKKGVWFEDVEFLYRYIPFINSIGVVNEPLYNYYQDSNSITHSFNHKLYDFIDNWNGLLDFYKENNLFKEYYFELEYSYVRYLYATFIKRLAKMQDKEEFKKGVTEVIYQVKKNFPEYKKNKYLKKDMKSLYLKYFNPIIANIVFKLEKNRDVE